MRDKLQIAKDTLIEKWVHAFDEMQDFKNILVDACSFKFSNRRGFSLENYANNKIKAGVRTKNKIPKGESFYFKYLFDKNNRLVALQQINEVATVTHLGYYNWHESHIEYIEYELQFSTPSLISKVYFLNGVKTFFETAILNGSESSTFYNEKDKEKRLALAADFLILDIKEYIVESNLIAKHYGYYKCGMEFLTENKYLYNEKNELIQIKTFHNTGNTSISYTKPSAKSLAALIVEIAPKLASYLSHVLSIQDIEDDLFCVQLGYQYCYGYWPNLSIIYAGWKDDAIENNDNTLLFQAEFLEVQNAEFAQLEELENSFSEFDTLMRWKENWQAGRKLLIETAKIMTEKKLFDLVPTSDDFIAFPIEWAMCEDVKTILSKCGASKENIRKWKKLDWF